MKINRKTIFKPFFQQPNLYMVSEQHSNEIMAELEPNTLAMFASSPPSIINSFKNTHSLISINVSAQAPLKLNTTNYTSWKIQLHNLLVDYESHGFY